MGRPKNPYKRCSRCKIEISIERKSTYCDYCHKSMMRAFTYTNPNALTDTFENKKMKVHLNEFVDRLKARNEMASIEEIFVEMITLHNHFIKDTDLERERSAKYQIPIMWKNLKAVSEKIKYQK